MTTVNEVLYLGNNFRFVRDKSVDLILTDPPFNVAQKSNFHTYSKNTIHSYEFDKNSEEKWDSKSKEDFLQDLNEWSSGFSRVLRTGGNFAIFCADAYVSYFMDALKQNSLSPRRVISWVKPNSVPINRKYMMSSAVEYIITGVKGSKATYNADLPTREQKPGDRIVESSLVADKVSSIINKVVRDTIKNGELEGNHVDEIVANVTRAIHTSMPNVEDRVRNMYKDHNGTIYLQGCIPNYVMTASKVGKRSHPTEKPVALLEYLISIFSKEGDTVLDPFAGSGSTGIACLGLGRNPILVERDTIFYQRAVSNIQQYL